MEERYEFTAKFELFRGALNGIAPMALYIILLILMRTKIFAGSWLSVLFSVLFLLSIILMFCLKGTVFADEDGVSFRVKLFFIPIIFKSYYYSDVKNVSCKIKHHHFRMVDYHSMDFSLTIPNGSIFCFSRRLKRSDGQYTSKGCEDMLELCTYVRNHIHKEIKENE